MATEDDVLCGNCRIDGKYFALFRLKRSLRCPRCRLLNACIPDRSVSFSDVVTLSSDRGELWLQTSKAIYGTQYGALYEDYAVRKCPDDSKSPGCSASGPSEPYTSAILRWMSHCRAHHHHPQQSDRILPASFRLIDVCSSRLVSLESLPRDDSSSELSYWALSYVWGSEARFALTSKTIDDLQQDGSVERLVREATLPKTLVDTIEFCRSVGQRYVWIDALCIVQDSEEKHNQVCAMDTIYSCADLVLVAAEGGSGSGLLPKGFLSNSYRMEEISGERFVACPSLWSASVEVCRSPWHSRGWTLQEYALSRRAAIFTANYILLSCGDELYDVYFDLTEPVRLTEADELKRPDMGKDPASGRGTALYRIIRQYINRSLTYPEDTLNALEGVFSQCLGGPERHFWGLPVGGFGNWFTWCCTFPGCKHPGRDLEFPSWSWAAWKHAGIACCVLEHDPDLDIDIYRFDDAGDLIRLHAKCSGTTLPSDPSVNQDTASLFSIRSGMDEETLSSTCFLWTMHWKELTGWRTKGGTYTECGDQAVQLKNIPKDAEAVFAEYVLISRKQTGSIQAMKMRWVERKKAYVRENPQPFRIITDAQWARMRPRFRWIPLA